MSKKAHLAKHKRGPHDEGFTLTELLIAVFVSAMVIGGLAGISALGARAQARAYRHGGVGTALLLAMRSIEADLAQARWVQYHTPLPSTWICVYNCTPQAACDNAYVTSDGSPPPSSTGGVSAVEYCWLTDSDGIGKIFQYASCPGTCGGGTYQILASHVESMTLSQPVSSPTGQNWLDIKLAGSWYSVATGTETLTLESQVTWFSPWKAGP
jgi:prepilin-type N-terminal cleavage/methylation domain-containing protein